MPQKINLVIVVLDGTYLLEEHFETISEAYLEPILKHMKQQQIIIEKEDKDKKEIEKNKITPKLKCGLVVFGNYEPISRSPVTTYYFEENLSQFEKLISGIEFEDGGMKENAVAEGLVAALEMFDAHKSQIKPEIPEATETIRHCLLISNSHPCPDLVHRNLDEKYDQFSMKQIVDEMKNQKIHLSLITPERNITELEDLVTEVNQGVEVHNATDVINSSHVVRLAGFKLPFTPPKEGAQKRKREDSTSSTGTNDQQISSIHNSGNEAKKVKLEQTPELVKEHPPISNGQLLGQPSQPQQTLSSIKKEPTATQNPPVQTVQQSVSQSSSVNTTSAQTTPKSQISTVPTATTSSTNSIPPQVIQIPPNILTQTQPPVKITQAATNNVTAVMQPSASTSPATISRPQRPALTTQQAMPASLMTRPQQRIPTLHAQLQARLAAMSPDERKQYFANLQSQQLFRNNPQLIRNALANANAQQISNPFQNALIQQELARRQQLNLGQTMLNGTQVPQIGSFVTSAAPVSTQGLNGFVTSAPLNTVQLDAFNASTVPQPVGYTSASTSVGTINTNTQFGGNATATSSTQLPVSTMINSISAGMNNVVTGQTATSINNGQIRPNLPQKKVNALWSGLIAWSTNSQGQKRELTCQVAAFPIPTKKAPPTSQADYMTQCWPDKMEISGISYAKDVLSSALTNSKIVSFLPSPTPTQENTNTFGVLMRILDGKKMAAFVRFPNAPNPNGGIVLFTNTTNNGPNNANNGPKLVGILFLDTPLPTSAPIAQGQQIRPPTQQTQALNMQQLQFLAASLRNQQQQPTMQMQASAAVLQQNALQQQQKLALHTQLQQQQQMASLPLNVQQMLQQQQQQRQAMQPTSMLQNGNDFYRVQQLLQTARNNNPGLNTQQLIAMLRQRQQSQQPTQ